jgi:hypothetical protein
LAAAFLVMAFLAVGFFVAAFLVAAAFDFTVFFVVAIPDYLQVFPL